jgi:hypothetical protein
MSKQTDWTSKRNSPKSLSATEGRRLVRIAYIFIPNKLTYTDYTDWGHNLT